MRQRPKNWMHSIIECVMNVHIEMQNRKLFGYNSIFSWIFKEEKKKTDTDKQKKQKIIFLWASWNYLNGRRPTIGHRSDIFHRALKRLWLKLKLNWKRPWEWAKQAGLARIGRCPSQCKHREPCLGICPSQLHCLKAI